MLDSDLVLTHHPITTHDGWRLRLIRAERPGEPQPGPPVLFVPGYGMNGYVYNHHPRGRSLGTVLFEQGFDPWTIDLRSTRTARPPSSRARPSLEGIAFIDIPAALTYIRTACGGQTPSAIGASLGGAMLYATVGREPQIVDRLVTMGSPLRMGPETLPLRAFGKFGKLVSHLPMRGTRQLATLGLPLITRAAPGALWFYLNPDLNDLSHPERLTRTIEDPSGPITAAMADWINHGDLVLGGFNVTQELSAFQQPLYVVYSPDDGVCPEPGALAALNATGGPAETLVIRTDLGPVRHADLFIGDFATQAVFQPIAEFLKA